jgi:hypothetical protein
MNARTNIKATRLPRLPRNALAVALTALCAVAWSVAGAACSSTVPSHGKVAAQLTIPFAPAGIKNGTEVIPVTVGVGKRFSVKVDTSDGPFFWSQQGAAPDRRVVKLVGDFNQGSCPSADVGCRVPYFHTLLAVARGTAVMTWRYHALACGPAVPSTGQSSSACPRVTMVRFDITVR